MKNYKLWFYMWIIVVIGIFVLLVAFGYMYRKKLSSYHEYEDYLVLKAKEYVDSNDLSLKNGDQISLKIDKLIKENYLSKKHIVDECKGKVTVKYNKGYTYKAKLTCGYYKTK